jgi:acetyltransferase-like isoleucine patch superfamily enzyme
MLNKYSSIDYELPRKNKERLKKYKEMFNMGDKCKVQFGVIMEIAHYQLGEIKIGNGVLLARNVDIDYTGGLEIGNGVGILEGVKILTHSHDSLGLKGTSDMKSRGVKKIHLSKLFIEDNVTIGTRAIIMPGVGRIGENSIISAGSIVRKRVPPNAIVAGNPAEIVTIFPADRRSKRWNEEEYDLVNPKKLLKKKG